MPVKIALPPNPTPADFAAARQALHSLPVGTAGVQDAFGSLEQIEARSAQLEKAQPFVPVDANTSARAHRAFEVLQDRYGNAITTIREGWESAAALRDGAAPTLGAETANMHYGRVRRSMEQGARVTIRRAYHRAFLLGKAAEGDERPLSADEKTALDQLQLNEVQYFLNYMMDREQGTGKMPPAQRDELYQAALREAFEAGRVFADLRSGQYMQWVPRRADKSHQESCPDCRAIRLGGKWRNGTYHAREIALRGLFPGGSETMCGPKCDDTLKRVPRPAGQPADPSATLASIELHPWGGPKNENSSFTGQGRTGREGLADRAKRIAWGWIGRKKGNAPP